MSLVKKGQEPISDEIRDKTFATMRHLNDNNICIDCQKKNPKWASIHLGIHLCIDCAGKHRQYGVIHSFVKSTNLDVWNYKQLLFMQKGSNGRALQYFRKCGIIHGNNRHIDYKSAVVQKYKAILTEQVDYQINGQPLKKVQQKTNQNINVSLSQESKNLHEQSLNKKQIPSAEEIAKQIKQEKGGKKKKEKKKKMGNQINIQDFQNLTFDDGVSQEQKQKIVKSYQSQSVQKASQRPKTQQEQVAVQKASQIKPQIKQLNEQQVAKKMQQLKQQKNVKSISSQQFRDQGYDNVQTKQKFNQFTGATSISSSSFNNQTQDNSGEAIQKIKDFVSTTGGIVFQKLSSYWAK